MQLAISDFLSIETNTSVTCAVLYDIIDSLSSRHATLKILTPIELYHTSASFTFNSLDMFFSSFILASTTFQYVIFNHTEGRPFDKAMTYWWNYFICRDIALSQPQVIRTNANNIVPFYGSMLRRTNYSAYEYSLGMRIANLYSACVKTQSANGGNGDGIDNDCDNRIDEETRNNIDDDNDGLIDEDISYAGNIVKHSSETAWEYHNSHKEPDDGVSTSIISIVISITVALTSVVFFIGVMFLADRIRRYGQSTRVSPICT